MKLSAEIANLESFQKAFANSERHTARGMWHATRRSLSRLRDKQLFNAKVNMRGQKGNPRRKASPAAGLRSKFRWKVYPEHPWGTRRDHSKSTHVKKISEVQGEYFTLAKPADYLENPQTITSKGPWIGIPIVNAGNPNAAKMRAGQRKPRAKPTWRKTSVILKKHKNRYNFRFQAKPGHTILWARDKKSQSPPFAVMLLVKRIHIARNYLEFFDTFESMTPEFLARYDDEMHKALERIANASKRS